MSGSTGVVSSQTYIRGSVAEEDSKPPASRKQLLGIDQAGNLSAAPARYRSFLGCDTMFRKVIRMLYRLQRHGLPIKAHFRSSLVLAYAVPAPLLRPLLPTGLILDTYGDFGFLAIALVDTRDLRPAFVPAQLGMGFLLWISNLYPITNNRRADAAGSTNTPKRYEPDASVRRQDGSSFRVLRRCGIKTDDIV